MHFYKTVKLSTYLNTYLEFISYLIHAEINFISLQINTY